VAWAGHSSAFSLHIGYPALPRAEDVEEADLLAPKESGSVPAREIEATRFLVGELAGAEWCESAPIKERAEAAGIRERTLQRAMQDLQVEVERRGYPSVSYWRLTRAPSVPINLARLEGPHDQVESGVPLVPLAPVAPVAPGRVEAGVTTNGAEPDYDVVQDEFDYYRSQAERS